MPFDRVGRAITGEGDDQRARVVRVEPEGAHQAPRAQRAYVRHRFGQFHRHRRLAAHRKVQLAVRTGMAVSMTDPKSSPYIMAAWGSA
ncbi:hypothetical protein [Streptomyces sp. NPDC003688]